MKLHKSKQTREGHLPVQVAFDERVLAYITAELMKWPNVEDGGKYVGYLLPVDAPQLRALDLDRAQAAFVVTDFLPSGPNAIRTAVELQPDGEYQERLFRQLERLDPEIEHLGTWHSHHCNGLQTLSNGDIRGYHRTVNKAAYRLDCFLASLIKRLPRTSHDVNWIDHFLFVRGDRQHYTVTDSIRIVEWPSQFGGLIDHESRPVETGERRQSEQIGEVTHPDQGPQPWHESEEGRSTLAEDKRSFAVRFSGGVLATRRGGAITMTGRLTETSVAVTYPATVGESQVIVNVSCERATILKISADLRWRQLAFTAAFLAAESLRPESTIEQAFQV